MPKKTTAVKKKCGGFDSNQRKQLLTGALLLALWNLEKGRRKVFG